MRQVVWSLASRQRARECVHQPWPWPVLNRKRIRMQLWVSLASEAACAAALQHAVAMYDIHDTETLQAVLQYDAAGLPRALCTALRAEAPSRSSTGTVPERIAVADAGLQSRLRNIKATFPIMSHAHVKKMGRRPKHK